MALSRWLLLVVVVLASCGPGTQGAVQPATYEVLDGPSTVLVPLPDGRLLAERDGRLLVLDPRHLDLEPTVIGLASDVGEVHAAVPMDGALLVLASSGTFVLRESAWLPSPLAGALDGSIRDAVMLPGTTDLWVTTERSLVRVAGGSARTLAIDEPLEGAELSTVKRPEGPALWVRLADRVLEVWRDRTGELRSASLVLPAAPSAIAGDASGTGWLVIDGRLHSLGADRRLVDHGFEVDHLLGSSASDTLWIFPSEGAPMLHTGGAFFDVSGVEMGASDRRALGPDGSLYVASATSVQRFAPRRDVAVEGPSEGALLVSPAAFTIDAQGAPTVEATIDGAPLETASDPLRVELEPAELGDGQHVLELRVIYDDGTLPTEVRRSFDVVTRSTWSEDVAPINEARCASCHGPEGPANTKLHTREAWMELSTLILMNVEQQRMPLNQPPLSQREIALIQLWTTSGYPE